MRARARKVNKGGEIDQREIGGYLRYSSVRVLPLGGGGGEVRVELKRTQSWKAILLE